MGACSSSNPSDVPLELSADEISLTYERLFDAVVKAAMNMLEAEIISKQQLSPPSTEILRGLCGVAALDLACISIHVPIGIELSQPCNSIRKENCPLYFRDLFIVLIELKDALRSEVNGVDIPLGDLSKLKQHALFYWTDSPQHIWGSCLQQYEFSLETMYKVAKAFCNLPEYSKRSSAVAARIEKAVRNNTQSNQITKPNPKTSSALNINRDEDDDDDEVGNDARSKIIINDNSNVTIPSKYRISQSAAPSVTANGIESHQPKQHLSSLAQEVEEDHEFEDL